MKTWERFDRALTVALCVLAYAFMVARGGYWLLEQLGVARQWAALYALVSFFVGLRNAYVVIVRPAKAAA
jgi:hypothetical protein